MTILICLTVGRRGSPRPQGPPCAEERLAKRAGQDAFPVQNTSAVELVEVSHDPEFGWRALCDMSDLLAAPADEVRAILHPEQPRYEEDGYSLVCATGLALWRPVKPEDVGDEPEDDHRDGRFWSTVSVAAAGYWPTARV